MTSPLPMRAAATTLDDEAWEDLLNFIDERRVIPIIGPELLQVETETGPRLLYDWVAEKLAAGLAVGDTPESIYAPQSEHAARERLFHEHHNNHLLLIGSIVTHWRAHLCLRMANHGRECEQRDDGKMLPGNHSDTDAQLLNNQQQ